MNIDFILNGEDIVVQSDPMEKTSVLLKEKLGVTSLSNDCMSGICGKCLIFFDNVLVNSCMLPVFKIRKHEIITYEGFSKTPNHDIVFKAFTKTHTELCEFCKNATLMAAGSLLEAKDKPELQQIKETMSSVYCRCQTASSVFKAAEEAVLIRFGGKYARPR